MGSLATSATPPGLHDGRRFFVRMAGGLRSQRIRKAKGTAAGNGVALFLQIDP
jgi:hypothetical protein